jgi:hypothetical protein
MGRKHRGTIQHRPGINPTPGTTDASARGQASEYLVRARLSDLSVSSVAPRETEVDIAAQVGPYTVNLQVKRMYLRHGRGLCYRASTRKSNGDAYSAAVHFVVFHCAEEDTFFVVPSIALEGIREVWWRPEDTFLSRSLADLAPYREAWWLLFHAAIGCVPEDVVVRILEAVTPRLALDGRATRYQLDALIDQLLGAWRSKKLPRGRGFPPSWVTVPARKVPARPPRLTMDIVMMSLFPREGEEN